MSWIMIVNHSEASGREPKVYSFKLERTARAYGAFLDKNVIGKPNASVESYEIFED